jgi:peptidoglycan/xylan/chitin deacetylase (PgdA/CDA1 family)
MAYLSKIPAIVPALATQFVWHMPRSEKKVFLTFDDGPTPGVTEKVLDLLARYNAKATFFCLGKQVEAHPHLFQRLLLEGHQIGNHTYSHPSGWKTKNYAYLKNVLHATHFLQSNLYRPPYGRITKTQAHALGKRFQLVMWDVLTGDYDAATTPEKCFERVKTHTESGSIIVMHDSEKAALNLLPSLEPILMYLQQQGYELAPLPTPTR